MNDSAARELLIYMVTSAAGLPGEPHSYGPLRMIESARRFARLMLDQKEDPVLERLITVIDAGRSKSMTDPEGFQNMLQEAAAVSVDLLDTV